MPCAYPLIFRIIFLKIVDIFLINLEKNLINSHNQGNHKGLPLQVLWENKL